MTGDIHQRSDVTSVAGGVLAIAVLLAASLIASCSDSAGLASPAPQQTSLNDKASSITAPSLPRLHTHPPQTIAAVPVTPVITSAISNNDPNFGPATIVGLDEAATVDLLGRPASTTDTPPLRSWRYASDTCVLDVFFYMDVNSQRFRALSFKLKSDDHVPDTSTPDAARAANRCYDEIRAKASQRAAK
jgi:hypothetical protein